MVPMTPKRLDLMIALPMLLMLSGNSSLADSGKIKPPISQPDDVLQMEIQDSTSFEDEKLLSPEILYDRTPCKLYGKC
jgi:hypothetical protein